MPSSHVLDSTSEFTQNVIFTYFVVVGKSIHPNNLDIGPCVSLST